MDTPVNRALVDIQRTGENKECRLSGLLNLTFFPSFLPFLGDTLASWLVCWVPNQGCRRVQALARNIVLCS